MPAADADLVSAPRLPFAPIKKSHILHCSCHFWYPKYRIFTPKARIIPLSAAFVSYLRADGILLPPDANESSQDEEFEAQIPVNSIKASSLDSDGEDSDAGEEEEDSDSENVTDPSSEWPEVHGAVESTIAELGGKVIPKLNWSAPKDATWINPTNSMECRTANDIYMMLKSSDFVTHDLEHAFDGCCDDDSDASDVEDEIDAHYGNNEEQNKSASKSTDIPYTLMLRKSFALNPSVEFRCFVRQKRLLAISQRSVNHFEFLFDLMPTLRQLITDFFNKNIRDSFPEDDFTFDVYVPDPYQKVWLIDFNPWAPRTDPLLFSWLELLTMDGPESILALGLGPNDSDTEASENEEIVFQPELRLIKRDDPEAYSFNTPQYSAHKLPKDVVEASQSGPGPLREFAEQWREVLNRQQPDSA